MLDRKFNIAGLIGLAALASVGSAAPALHARNDGPRIDSGFRRNGPNKKTRPVVSAKRGYDHRGHRLPQAGDKLAKLARKGLVGISRIK